MQFNSYIFVLLFLPCSILGYFLLNKYNDRWGKIFLLALSLFYYYPTGIGGVLILCTSIAVNYFLAHRILKCRRKKWILAIGLTLNIGILLYCKYFNFFVENINTFFEIDIVTKNIIIPLGISFYTFQQIAYLVEVYKKGEIIGGFGDYTLYILYFPKLLMGPVAAPDSMIVQFNESARKRVDTENLVAGIQMFGYGLFKKVLIADTFAGAVSWAFSDLMIPTSGDFILVMLSYTFQIYFDFSGYSDMAIGISKMLNIDLPMNFDSPYKAISVRDFWKRWHISLTKFLTDYIYIPLGGNKKGKTRTYINTLIVFLISGIWHGANWTFILWGVIHGLGSVTDRMIHSRYSKLPKIFQWLITFIFINILWLLFRSETISDWFLIIKNIVFLKNMAISEELINCFILPEFNTIFRILHIYGLSEKIRGFEMLIVMCFSFAICILGNNNYNRRKGSIWGIILVPIAITWSLICLGTESTFVYFNF